MSNCSEAKKERKEKRKHKKRQKEDSSKKTDEDNIRSQSDMSSSLTSVSKAIQIIIPKTQTGGCVTLTSGANTHPDPTGKDKVTCTEAEDWTKMVGGRIVSSSAQEFQPIVVTPNQNHNNSESSSSTIHPTATAAISTSSQPRDVTLLLFYQYIEPLWTEDQFQHVLTYVQEKGQEYSITGRMRVAYEGLNCTLTGSFTNIRSWCKALREYPQGTYFSQTEFKLTDDLPRGQAFPKLHAFKVEELVHYGLDGKQHIIPSINMTGVHLEPHEYHMKMAESNTVIIDVRNHYEAAIGRFDPPTQGATYIDPQMRKSTEFPSWLDKPSTKELLRGKQVLMYCTGGKRYM